MISCSHQVAGLARRRGLFGRGGIKRSEEFCLSGDLRKIVIQRFYGFAERGFIDADECGAHRNGLRTGVCIDLIPQLLLITLRVFGRFGQDLLLRRAELSLGFGRHHQKIRDGGVFIFGKDPGDFYVPCLHPGRNIVLCAIHDALLHGGIDFTE